MRMLIRTGSEWVYQRLVQCHVCKRMVQDTDAVYCDGEYTCHICMK